jgi:DNA-binding MarR family transcriptional regulator
MNVPMSRSFSPNSMITIGYTSGMSADWAWMAAWATASNASVRPGLIGLLRSNVMAPNAPKAPARRTRVSDPPPPEPPSLEASLIGTVGPVMRHLVGHARRHQTWGDLTYQQYNVLRMIDTMGPQTQADVARRLMVTAPVVTRLASALVDAGLVARLADARDRRTVRLELTPKGRRQARAMRRDLLAAAHELLEPLPEERRAAVAAALEELQVLLPEHSARR